MKIVKNEKLIKRNAAIGQYTSLAALGVLALGMYVSVSKPDQFLWAVGALVAGFVMTQIGMFFSNRFGRNPRPDQQLDAALKGLPGDTVLYHYVTSAPHVLVGAAGVWVLHTYHQRGKVTYSRNRWRLAGGGFMQAYMSIFGQEGLGRPELDVANEISGLKKQLARHMEDGEIPEIQAALVFTNEDIEIDAPDAPWPTLKAKQLKDFLRQRAKDRPIGQSTQELVKQTLGGGEAPSE